MVYRSSVCFKSSMTEAAVAPTTASSSINSSNGSSSGTVPTLKLVPKLPLVGSLLYAHSRIPRMDQNRTFDFWPAMRKQFGDFYSMGIPGLGAGLTGTVYVIQDPVEMARIIRSEGKYPFGAAALTWSVIHYGTTRADQGSQGVLADLFSIGPQWKRVRSFLQTDLLHPTAAARYIPSVLEAAASSSRGASSFAEEGRLNEYLNKASFEMFSNVMMGQLPCITDPTRTADPVEVEFCDTVATALQLLSTLNQSAWDFVCTTKLGYKTSTYKRFESAWGTSQRIAQQKVEDLYQRRLQNKLTSSEQDCYANQAFERFEAAVADKDNDSSFSVEEVKTLIGGLLSAGVDTTGGLLSWKLLHVALCPATQERIYAELTASMKKHNVAKLTPECIAAKEAPYLHAAIRESHRLANASIPLPIKLMPEAITVHGVPLPAGSFILFDNYSTGLRPELVGDEPLRFDPSRFLPEAVAARKETPSALLDHPFFNGPFSQGARKCPGSRVANMETVAFIGQLVLDWKMTVPGIQHWTEVPYDLSTVTTAKLPPMKFTPRTAPSN